MNTPASTPAPQKITPESRFVFPCWAYHVPSVRWVRLKTHFDIGLGIARQLLGFGYSHYAPDSETAPTCTPSEGEKPACKYCGGTGVVSYSAGGESRLDECGCGATPQPTHSAQEAAKRAAMTLVPVASPTPPYHMLEESEWHDKVARVTAIILRHFHSTPTQSQQPPLSPGSGEAERLEHFNDVASALSGEPELQAIYIEAAAIRADLDLLYKGQNVTVLRRIQDRLKKIACGELRETPITPLLAQPATSPLDSRAACAKELYGLYKKVGGDFLYRAIEETLARHFATPPLPSGEELLKARQEKNKWRRLAYKLARDHLQETEALYAQIAQLKSAPPLPSIGDGKDGDFDQWWATHCYEVRDTVEGHPRHPAMNQSERLKEGARIVWRARQ